MEKQFAKLLEVKSIVTIIMTVILAVMVLCPNVDPPKEVLALYCTSYGAVLTYYFTRKDDTK